MPEEKKKGLPRTTENSPKATHTYSIHDTSANCNRDYDISSAVTAQARYCKERGLPLFAPLFGGRCYRCERSIYEPIEYAEGKFSGISVEEAGRMHITYCPHCHASFDD